MADNPFRNASAGIGDVPRDAVSIDLSSTDHVGFYRQLRADTAGTIKVDTIDGSVARNMAFGAGESRLIMVSKIYKVGTTATGIEGMP